jgi:hypothetical protein
MLKESIYGHITYITNLLLRIIVGLKFTFKSRSIDDNYLFHFNFLFICYNIHLLVIISHLSLVFKFLPRMCHPITKTLKSLNNNQSKNKQNKRLNLPNNNDCHHYPRTSSSLKQTIVNNI